MHSVDHQVTGSCAVGYVTYVTVLYCRLHTVEGPQPGGASRTPVCSSRQEAGAQREQEPTPEKQCPCLMQPLAVEGVVAIVTALKDAGFPIHYHVLDTHLRGYFKNPTGKIDIAISASIMVSCCCQHSVDWTTGRPPVGYSDAATHDSKSLG